MATILEKAKQILDEKNNKLLAENIKKGVQIFDVTGTYEGGSNIPQMIIYNTDIEMIKDVSNANGKLGVCQMESSTMEGPVKETLIPCLSNGTEWVLPDCKLMGTTSFKYLPIARVVGTIDISNITDAEKLFYFCRELLEVPELNTSNITNMNYMFYNCTKLTSIPLLDTSNVTSMSDMFGGCTRLTEIPLFNTSNVASMWGMFRGCTNLVTVPSLDTNSLRNTYTMFYDCASLTKIPQLNTSNVSEMSYMFGGCTNLVTIPLLDTSNVISLNETFKNCPNLSNESLNNILAMCKNATKLSSNKTLKYIGLTSAQATTCTTLSNYSAFTAAGWTTGY